MLETRQSLDGLSFLDLRSKLVDESLGGMKDIYGQTLFRDPGGSVRAIVAILDRPVLACVICPRSTARSWLFDSID